MKGNIFGRIIRYKKWKDFYCFNRMECILSIIFTIGITRFILRQNVYNELTTFIEPLKNITLYIASALIGVLGLVLAGVSIIISLMQSKNIRIIAESNELNDSNDETDIIRVLVSFEFISLVVGILAIMFFCIYFSLYSKTMIISEFTFYFLTFIMTYMFCFVLFYIVALVGNCIKVFYISKIYDGVIPLNREDLLAKVGEVREDFILIKLQEIYNQEDIADELINYANEIPIKDKVQIVNYLKAHYGKKKNK